ncbi:MAG: energy transducer TonB [Nitrospira sp.]
MSTLAMPDNQLIHSSTFSWAFSVLFHAAAVAAAVVVLSDLRLAPQPEPFKWDVSVVEPMMQPNTTRQAQPTPPPSPQQKPSSEPVKPQPVVQAVQAVQRVVQQEVRTVTPVVQPTPQPMETIARTAQPIEPADAPAAPAAAPAVSSEPAPSTVAAAPVTQMPVRSAPAPQRDYGWLAETLRDRIEELKRYPPMARMNNWQGKVVLKFVVKEDGTVENLEVVQSSGHTVLDEAAMDTIRRASPLPLKHELGKPRVTFQFPINYMLR